MAGPDALIARARDRHAAGDLAQARSLYEAALRLVPRQPDALTLLASLAYQEGDEARGARLADAAIDAYRQMLLGAPNNHPLRAALANLLLARERGGEAVAVIARALLGIYPVRAEAADHDARRRRARARGLPGIVINALPKSASESIWNKLAEGLALAQGHISIGLFPDCLVVPYRARDLARGGLAAKEHLAATAANLQALDRAGIKRIVIHLREPRQATLSWAHFLEGDVRKRLLAPLWRKTTPPAGFFAKPFGAQLDWHINHYLPLAMTFIDDWVTAAEAGAIEVAFLDFETFRTDADGYFDRLLAFYEIDPAGFARDAKAETIHLRKGAIDEWRSVFTPAQRTRAWEKIPDALADRFGWRP